MEEIIRHIVNYLREIDEYYKDNDKSRFDRFAFMLCDMTPRSTVKKVLAELKRGNYNPIGVPTIEKELNRVIELYGEED